MSYADLATSQALSTSQEQAANTVFNFYSAGAGGGNSRQDGSATASASASLGGGDAVSSAGPLAGINTKTIVICAAILVGVVGLVVVHHYIKKS